MGIYKEKFNSKSSLWRPVSAVLANSSEQCPENFGGKKTKKKSEMIHHIINFISYHSLQLCYLLINQSNHQIIN